MTALRGLQDALDLRSGETLLVHGASGAMGHLAVQLGKRLGPGSSPSRRAATVSRWRRARAPSWRSTDGPSRSRTPLADSPPRA
jgi:hypothetical protein